MAAADKAQAVSEAPREIYVASAAGKYLAGRFARRNRDFGNAAELLTDALSLDSANRKIRRQAFFSLVASGRLEQAAKLARKIVGTNAGEPISNLTLVVEDMRRGQLDQAATRLVDMPRRGMNTFTSPLLLAWLRQAQGKTGEAVKALDGLSKVASFVGLRHLHVGLIEDLAGRDEAADKSLSAAVKSTASLRAVQAYGRFLERKGRTKEARALYKNFIDKNNDTEALDTALDRLKSGKKPKRLISNPMEGMAEVFFNLSGTLAQGRSNDLALIYGRFALRLRPSFPLAQVLLGGLLESLDRKTEALSLYEAVSPDSPLYWSARLRKAATLDDLKRTDEAITQLQKMAEERTDQSEPFIRLGDLFRTKKQYQDSVDSYSGAIKRIGKLSKSHWSLLYARGIAYERSKQWQNAETDFLRALKLSPEQPFVLNYLGYSWVDQGKNFERAKEMIERAVQLRPNDGYIVDSLGWVLYKIGEYDNAARKLERAVILRPEDPTINDHLGDAYWRVGRFNEARFQWNRALSLEPEKKDVPAIEKKLRKGLVDAPSKDSRG
ncbi:MAG: tetratricopeptide repeat protein [Rhodospirillaceae bacterium]|nr:tetratricopeptide repeat protein [Rhodospirillaceae bacterium]MBT5455596.1 tetratricopeptide repeat protein [Rhodospirillaceae bacterium]